MKKVVKFGGSSLANAEQFQKVGDIIRSEESRRYVVPSAPGKRFSADTKVTDLLYACYDKAEAGEDFSDILTEIKSRFYEIIKGLNLDLSLEEEFRQIEADFKAHAGNEYAASRGEFLNGKVMAAYLGYEFIDTDLYIEAQEGMTIPDIFEKKGEAYFRALETDVIRKLREKTHCVIATGGGLPLRKENSDLLKEVGTVYYLMADADTTYARVKHCTNRPLLQCDDPYTKIQAMMKERGPVYARACHIRVRTDHGTLEEVMDEIK